MNGAGVGIEPSFCVWVYWCAHTLKTTVQITMVAPIDPHTLLAQLLRLRRIVMMAAPTPKTIITAIVTGKILWDTFDVTFSV